MWSNGTVEVTLSHDNEKFKGKFSFSKCLMRSNVIIPCVCVKVSS